MSFVVKIFVVFLLLGGLSEAALANVHGVFQVVKGKVQIKSGKDGKIERAKIGQKVFPKDTIITGADSRAKIVMVDTNVINVSPDSSIVLENYEFKPEEQKKNVLINVIYGKVRSKVNQKYDGDQAKFQVKTKSAVAGVRGTDFLASFNPQKNESSVVTFEGEVEFGKPGPNGTIQDPVAVSGGQTADAAQGAPPGPPRAVPAQMLASMDKESDAESAGSSDERTPAGDKGEKGKDDDKDKKEDGDKGKGEDGDKGKSDEAKDENKTDNDTNKDDKSNEGKSAGPVGDDGGRAPASDGTAPSADGSAPATETAAPAPSTSGMFLDSDFAGGGGDAVMVGDDSMMTPAFDPVVDGGQVVAPIEQIECEFCNRLIENGTARVLIQIQNGSAP